MGNRLKTAKKRWGKLVKFGKKAAKGAGKAYKTFYKGVGAVQKGARKIQEYEPDFDAVLGTSEIEAPQVDFGFNPLGTQRRKHRKSHRRKSNRRRTMKKVVYFIPLNNKWDW